MKLVTRTDLGWPTSAAPDQATTKGVKVHYEGTPVSTKLSADHDLCIAEWQAIRKSHLANKKENYSDIAYNYGACPHGYLLEGRGLGKRTGANGDQPLNRAHYAIVGLVGSEGLTMPTDAMLGAIRDGIDLLRKHGAGTEIKGHRDGYATACPGKPLYTWIQAGAPRPAGTAPKPAPAPKPTPAPQPKVSLAHLVKAAHTDPHATQGHKTYEAGVKPVEAALLELGYLTSAYAHDGSYGTTTVAAYAAYQRHLGYSGTAADGIPGKTSLSKLGKTTGLFTVTS